MPDLDRRFWITHALLPLALFAVLATLLATTDLDPRIADWLFFDPQAHRFLGKDTWWARGLIHTGGRDAMRAIVAAGLVILGASFFSDRLRPWRRPAAYVVACLVGATLFVGILKQLTNVDCPWDLARYGGTRPFVHLFEHRPGGLPRAACFPGAHSSSGFALFCFYFLLRGRRRAAAGLALVAALATGAVFAFGQQARGAHFLSHDLWSACIAWFVCLGLHVGYRRAERSSNGSPGAPARTVAAPLSALLLALLAGAMPPPASAADALVIEARRIVGPGLRARDARLRLDLARPAAPQARLQVAHVELGEEVGRIVGLDLRCATPVLDGPRFGCARARVSSADSPLGPLRFTASLWLDADTGVFESRGGRIPLGGGQARFAVRNAPTDWSADAGLDGVTLPGLRGWLSKFVALPADLSLAGQIDGSASLRGRDALGSGRVALQLSGAGFSDEAGTTVGENLALEFSATLESRRGGALGIEAQLASAGGQALAGPVLLDLGANPLTLAAHGSWGDGVLAVEAFTVVQRDLAELRGQARLRPVGGGPLVEAATLELQRVEMPAAYTSFLQIALAATDFGTLETAGTLSGRVELENDALTRVDATLDGLDLRDTKGRVWLRQLGGALHWTPAAAAAPADSYLQWREGGAYGLAGGAARLDFVAQGAGFALRKPARLPIFDGALAIRELAVKDAGSDALTLLFEGDIEPISMPRIARAFGWPEFAGTLSGRIPRVEFRDKLLSFGGDLEALVFDGRIVGRNLRLQDPLGRWPRLFADLELRQLDLALVTRTFEIGSITGRIEGEVKGLELFAWSPVAFDGYLQTPPGDRGRHRISARAVGSLSNIGGGGGGVVAALQGGFLSLFDEYDYARLGLRCRLANDVCQMSGVEPAGQGYYILKGRGLPRINIIGNAGRVNWPQLLSQIRAQMSGGGTVRIE